MYSSSIKCLLQISPKPCQAKSKMRKATLSRRAIPSSPRSEGANAKERLDSNLNSFHSDMRVPLTDIFKVDEIVTTEEEAKGKVVKNPPKGMQYAAVRLTEYYVGLN